MYRSRHSSRSPLARGLAALLVVTSFFALQPAYSAPADIFSMPAPMIGASPPKAMDLKDGDATVSTQTGALQYSYPIAVPPGRNGMAPQLALSYSSQAATYGGIAAGWSLSIPEITEDTSAGQMRTRSPAHTFLPDHKRDDRFVSSMAGGRRLVLVTEPTGLAPGVYANYRAQNDDSFTRYERMNDGEPFRWRARMSNGTVATFGESSRAPGCRISDQFAPLTGMVDPFGNEVRYLYGPGYADECVLQQIEWGQNANAGLTQPLARVVFHWDMSVKGCPGTTIVPNSQVRFQNHYPDSIRMVSGASRLEMITAMALGQGGVATHTREIQLSYDKDAEDCNRPHAPVRLLKEIRERAWGADAPLAERPPVSFAYNDPAIHLTTPHPSTLPSVPPWGSPAASQAAPYPFPSNIGWGYRRNDGRPPTVEAMLLDVDGDGLLDYVFNSSVQADGSIGECQASWFRNKGPNANGVIVFDKTTVRSIWLPRLKWRGDDVDAADPSAVPGSPVAGIESGEGCSLAGQITAFQNSTNQWPAGTCHGGENSSYCRSATDPLDDNQYCGDAGTQCPRGAGGDNLRAQYTNLAYRWLDMDNDGLPDLVAAIHGNVDFYDIDRGSLPVHWNGEPGISGIPGIDEWPACPNAEDAPARCKGLGDCLEVEKALDCDPSTLACSLDFADVNQCLATGETTPCADIMYKQPLPGPYDGGSIPPTPTPYSRCEGLYPWFIYKNLGNGSFATSPIIKYQPVPLESEGGDSSFGGPGVASTNHAIQDIDGDGILDALVREDKVETAATSYLWDVWLGDGQGGFDREMYIFPSRMGHLQNAFNATGHAPLLTGFSTNGLLDVNGDGLVDHWWAIKDETPGADPADAFANIAFNDGVGLRLFSVPGQGPTGEYTTPVGSKVKPGSDTFVTITSPNMPPLQAVREGVTSTRNRVVDVDHDGRVDVVRIPQQGDYPLVYFNVGGQFSTQAHVYQDDLGGLRRRTTAQDHCGDSSCSGDYLTWRLDGDLRDLDGDGIEEGHYISDGKYVWARPSHSQPPRLLRRVENGSGATTDILYASMHEEAVVTQAPQLTWPDGERKASPRAQWVVKSLRTEDVLAGTDGTTTYHYKHPRYSPDDEGRYAFRGFEQVTTTSPSGSRTAERFGFEVDWSGRKVATVVYPAASEATVTDEVRSISTTQWGAFTILGGAITTYHPVQTESLTCSNGQTEATCTPSSAAAYTRTTSTWTAYPEAAAPADTTVVVATRTLRQADASPSLLDGDRETHTTYQLDADLTKYLLNPRDVTQNHRVNGTWELYAKSRQTWDPTFGTKLTEEVWIDANDANRAISRWVYDNTTGNVIEKWKPKQNAANTTKTTYSYDPKKLFVATETNEEGHQLDYVYEYGTGTRLQTEGPNVRTCTSGAPNCPDIDATHPAKEQHRIRVDGLGRTIERYETWGNDGYYTSSLVETNTYTNANPLASQPASVSNRLLMSIGQTTWIEKTTELDGHGRVMRERSHANGSAPADAITTYTYDDDGTLASVSVPDPTANDASVVTYTYDFDSLGRPISIRRPDSTISASGVDMTYDGVVTTTTEVVGSDGGTVAQKRTTTDDYGRLVLVEEKAGEQGGTPQWAATVYSFGPDDNVATITDPESNVTELIHDMAGRRTHIQRANRTWSYEYDANGNVILERAPPPDPNDPVSIALWTSTFAYDDLDRVTQKVVAPRDLTTADRELFGSNLETYTYDVGFNRTSRLYSWAARGPNATTDTLITVLTYDAQGRLVSHRQYARGLAGFSDMERWFSRNFHIFGGEATTRYYDNQFGGDSIYSIVDYDARGLPNRIRMPGVVIAQQTRNVAGLVTKRRSETTGPMMYVESNWAYDKLGRVTDQHVQQSLQANPGPLTVVRQELAYFGNDDVKTLRHHLGASSHQFTYSYDHRHQITGVTTDTTGYFDGTYEYGAAGRLDRVAQLQTLTPSGAELVPRDVDYYYGGIDAEQVTELRHSSTGQIFAEYSYDSAGNQVTRSYPDTDESWDFMYDGNNRLRRVIKYDKQDKSSVVGSEEYWYINGARSHVLKRDAAGKKTELIWFIGDVQAHYDEHGAVTKVYSHLSLGTPVARLERTGVATTSLEYQYHGLASHTLAAVAQDGTVNASFSYAPFGEVLEATNGGGTLSGVGAHARRFNDKFQDKISGLAYYGHRYYDKTLIGWTQSDPLYRFKPDRAWKNPRQGLLYGFSLNNPLSYIDPDGLESLRSVCGGDSTCMKGKRDMPAGPGMRAVLRETFSDVAQAAAKVGSVVETAGDALSFLPLVGSAGDALSAAGAALQGKWVAAGIALAATVTPGVGSGEAKLGKAALEEGVEQAGKKVGSVPKPPRGKGSVPVSQRDSRRAFTTKQQREKAAEQGNKCGGDCGKTIDETNSEGHHIERWADGGRTVPDNQVQLCSDCHDRVHSKD